MFPLLAIVLGLVLYYGFGWSAGPAAIVAAIAWVVLALLVRGVTHDEPQKVAPMPGSELPDMFGAVSQKMRAVADAMERGQSFDEAVSRFDASRKTFLTLIGPIERAFIPALEATISAKGRREFEAKTRSAEGFLLAAIGSYKERAYVPALDYCNGSLSYDSNSARALGLRGLVAAGQTAPDYASAMRDLERAVELDPSNSHYRIMLEAVRRAAAE